MFVCCVNALLSALLGLSGAGPSDGSTPTATDPTAGVSVERCLALGDELIRADKFAEARPWFEAALRRAQDAPSKRSALLKLKSLDLLGRAAPGLRVGEWVQGEPSRLDQLAGRVVLLDFFQSVCPASRHVHPQVAELARKYEGRGLTVISIAVAFEMQEHQSPEVVRTYAGQIGYAHRIALDADLIRTFAAYQCGGSPYAALIDRAGRLRLLAFFELGEIEGKMLQLLAETPDHRLPGRRLPMPQSRGGRDLVGTRAPRLYRDLWINTPGGARPDLLGRPRLIRFFMDGCAYCTATAPALNRIHRDFGEAGLMVIGVYHPKPRPREVGRDEVLAAVNRLEISFPVTVDADWSYLRKLWLGEGARDFTSASFLIDRKGVIRYVHPGPEFFPSGDKDKRQQNEDYEVLRKAIEAVLAE